MSNLTATVKESLIGSSEDQAQPVSSQIKSNFYRNARKDEETGELYMNEEDFVNAVAPAQEDYVSRGPLSGMCHCAFWEDMLLTAISDYSTKSSEISMGCSSRLRTSEELGKSISPIGLPLSLCWQNQTPSTKSLFVSSTRTVPVPSNSKPSRSSTTLIRPMTGYPLTGTQNGLPCTPDGPRLAMT